MKIETALLSVSDKEGLLEFARGLHESGVQLLSTGGTAKALRDAGLPVEEVAERTGFPEIMNGRVKTLHPKIHGGLLAVRDNPDHLRQARDNGIGMIDLVCVNLYPFQKTVADPMVKDEAAIENIDIGGPSMIRSAAKNHRFVTVVTDSGDYARVLFDMKQNGGATTEALRRELAIKAFGHTATYDSAIATFFSSRSEFPELLTLQYRKVQDLRYGENPHQKAAFYRAFSRTAPSVAFARIHEGGKEVSYNNLLDLDSAFECVLEFHRPSAVIVKHNNPCGAGSAGTALEAFTKALSGDPSAAYGGIVAFNVPVDGAAAEAVAARENFFEAIVAPGFVDGSLRILREKPKWGKNLRVFDAAGFPTRREGARSSRALRDGLLHQALDEKQIMELRPVGCAPTDTQKEDLLFAWLICKHVKSNAIVLASNSAVVGVGAGQMSRVDSARLAVQKAGGRAKGSVAASDAFFPFADGVELLIEAGVAAFIQPGGSIRDDDVFNAARKRNIPMVLTGMRHFKH